MQQRKAELKPLSFSLFLTALAIGIFFIPQVNLISMRRRGSKPEAWTKIAEERISILFGLAGKEFAKHPERSKRYVELARRIGMRYNVRFSKDMKMRFCRKCFSYLKPGVSSRVRTNKDRQAVTVTCLSCGHISRYPYKEGKGNNKTLIK